MHGLTSSRTLKRRIKKHLHCPVCLTRSIRVVHKGANLDNPRIYCQNIDCRTFCSAAIVDGFIDCICYHDIGIIKDGYYFGHYVSERDPDFGKGFFRVCVYNTITREIDTLLTRKGNNPTKLRQFAKKWFNLRVMA
jgi:hypothetical protein